jgi:hypothetical protein
MRFPKSLARVALAMSSLLACTDESGAPADDAGEEAGANPDEATLKACELEEPCFESNAQMVENRIAHILLFDCVMRGLADRTPGRYAHLTDSTFSNGSAGARHTLVVAGDGSALYTRVPYVSGPVTIDGSDAAGQRCVLKPASYFEACATALASYSAVPFGPPPSDALWACAFGNGDATTPSELAWFESCEELSPLACE